jgi:epoxide hydrolase 4
MFYKIFLTGFCIPFIAISIISIILATEKVNFEAIGDDNQEWNEILKVVKQKTIKLPNGSEFNVNEAGNPNGKLILFLHGFPETGLLSWKRQFLFFVNKGYFVVAPDLRGYNTSHKFNLNIEKVNSDGALEDLEILVKQIYKKEKIFLVSHDWGAFVAYGFLSKHQELIEKVVFLAIPHPLVMQKALRSFSKQTLKSWYILYFQLRYLVESGMRLNDYRVLVNMLVNASPEKTFTKQDLEMYKKAWSQEGEIEAMLLYYRYVVRYKMFEKLEEEKLTFEKPLLLIMGKEDSALDYNLGVPSMKYAKNGKFILYENCSHWIQQSKHEQLNIDIFNFINS